MGRIHLFEFEDQKWFPAILRNFVTDFLQFISSKSGIYKPVVPLIENVLLEAETDTIIDLGSGGGGAIIGINKELLIKMPQLKIILTDYYPNLPAFRQAKKTASNIEFISSPVDASDVSPELKGLRTLFLVFHHFKPDLAVQVIQNAIDTQSPIAIFESQERNFLNFFGVIFSPLTVLYVTPFIRPFSIKRLIFTYLIPIVPLVVLWDGMVSVMRTNSVKEMKALLSKVNGKEKYDWKIDKINSGLMRILFLTGKSKN